MSTPLSLGQWARLGRSPANTDRFFEKVTRIEGVFSGTLSYIFNEFSTGSADGPAFSTVVRTARDKGYTVCLLSSHRHDRRSPVSSPSAPLTSSPSLHFSPFYLGVAGF
jgi:hypothetical protein